MKFTQICIYQIQISFYLKNKDDISANELKNFCFALTPIKT